MVYCLNCGVSIDEYDSGYYARNMNCIPCYNRKQSESVSRPCSRCGRSIRVDESRSNKGYSYCSYCFSEIQRLEKAIYCAFCKKQIKEWEEKFRLPDGKYCCKKCHESSAGKMAPKICSICKRTAQLRFIDERGNALCMQCAQDSPYARSQMHGSPTKLSSLLGNIKRMLA